VVLSRNESIALAELPPEFGIFAEHSEEVSSRKTLRELEFQAISDTLRACNGNKSMTAKMLHISRKALYKRLREGISVCN
jgi:DNA-binding NtrC family response regulator